jgi:2'-5' RNA ligase
MTNQTSHETPRDSASPKLVRSFVAVPLPGAVRTEIAGAAAELARSLPHDEVSWTRKPENFHVTMKFLGNAAPERLEALGAALGEAFASVPPFTVDVERFGAFPSPKRASVIFAGVTDHEGRLSACAAIVESVAERIGFTPGARAFHGHVTVGRHKRGVLDAHAVLDGWADRRFGTIPVQELHVYESQLGSEGSTYILRHRAELAGAN